ncbi:MAG TPA: ADP-ribosylation/crystallin J1 [Mycobacteriales bacterium]|jgi:hypothetical protein
MVEGTVTLWRPTGPQELDLVRASGWLAWPPRPPEQPIFYPVLDEQYAIGLARDCNAPFSGVGYVTRFDVWRSFLDRYPVHQIGASVREYHIPAGDLPELNENLVGPIVVVHQFRAS